MGILICFAFLDRLIFPTSRYTHTLPLSPLPRVLAVDDRGCAVAVLCYSTIF